MTPVRFGALLALGVGYLRYRRWRVRDVALRSKKIAKARGISQWNAARAADPRKTPVW